MSRRIEITVPNEWKDPVRECLRSPDKCNLSERNGKPSMVVELSGPELTLFLVTIPGPAVSGVLDMLRKNGIGNAVGRIILCSLDYTKPEISKPLIKADITVANIQSNLDDRPVATSTKAQPFKGFQHFVQARKTTEEMYNDISNGANMTVNTWMNLIGASIMAAGGLTSNATVFIVASMLVSPIMGPILGMTFGYRVADWPLFRTGFLNEFKMAVTTYLCGAIFGMILGDVGQTYKWPTSAMMPDGQAFNLIISILVSAAAGMVLGVSLTSTGGNALVGTAISAGLLPPLVNAGMLHAYAMTWAQINQKSGFYEMGWYSVIFYCTHVVTIIATANLIFWLKDIDPRFKQADESDFNDIPSIVEHKRKLEAMGKTASEQAKAEFFIEQITGAIKEDVAGFASGFKKAIKTGLRRGSEGGTALLGGRRRGSGGGLYHSSSHSGGSGGYRSVEDDDGDIEIGAISGESQGSKATKPSNLNSNPKGKKLLYVSGRSVLSPLMEGRLEDEEEEGEKSARNREMRLSSVEAPRARVMKRFVAGGKTEISLNEGDMVEILQRTSSSADWWYGRIVESEADFNTDHYGYFPGSFVELIDYKV